MDEKDKKIAEKRLKQQNKIAIWTDPSVVDYETVWTVVEYRETSYQWMDIYRLKDGSLSISSWKRNGFERLSEAAERLFWIDYYDSIAEANCPVSSPLGGSRLKQVEQSISDD